MEHYTADTFNKIDLTIPGLGDVTGIEFSPTGTRQFLGIQYATYSRRFAPSKLATGWEGKFDATTYKPRFVQGWGQAFFPFLPRPWLPNDGLDIEESEGPELLALNVTVPKTDRTDLPVLVWIHGGANVYCGVNTLEFDGVELATLSEKLGKPTIVVTVGFRVGMPGYLYSKDIKELNAEEGLPDTANFGFWDQVNALKWVRQHIPAFGGDPNNITIFGQSAGSACVHLHVLRGEPLFRRAIMQSGVFDICGLVSEEEADSFYQKVLDSLGINKPTARERVAELCKVDAKTLSDTLESFHHDMFAKMPNVADGYLEIKPLTEVLLPGVFDAVMLGDTFEEFPVGPINWTNLTPQKYWDYLQREASPELLEIMVRHYGVSPDLSQEQVYATATVMAGDATFCLRNYIVANNPHNETTVYCYHFDKKSDFELTKGLAHHSLDFTYIWNMFNSVFDDSSKRLAFEMGSKFIAFANGETPWEPHTSKAPHYQIFDAESEVLLESTDNARTSRYAAWKEIIALGLHKEFWEVVWPLAITKNGTI